MGCWSSGYIPHEGPLRQGQKFTSPCTSLPVGLLKLCTLGFFLIGHLIDFLLILVQVVGPADRSDYYAPFYGPLLNRTGVFVPVPMNDSISSTCLSNYTTLGLEDLDMGM